MEIKEYCDQAGRILGIKTATVSRAEVGMHSADHLKQEVNLKVIPTISQAKKLKKLVLEFANLKEIDDS